MPHTRVGLSGLLVLCSCLLLPGSACVMPRFVPRGGRLPAATPAPARPAGGVKVKQLTIRCRAGQHLKKGCGLSRSLAALSSRLGSRIEEAGLGRVGSPVEVAIDVEAVWRSHQTGVFDALAVLTAGLFPLVPQWGHSSLQSRLLLSRPSVAARSTGLEDTPLATIDLEVKVPYTTHWYSWFRADAPTRAFEEAWSILADQVIARLRARLAALPAGKVGVASFREERPGAPDDELVGEIRPVTGARVPGEQTTVVLDRGSEWRVLFAPRKKVTARGLLGKYLSALSGLEGGYFLGKAWVSSQARDSFGATYTVASGQASSSGWRLGAYTIPRKTDWFIFPTLGFFSLDIDIHDFRDVIPLAEVPGAQAIPGLGSDPATGRRIDLGDPNVYRLELRSAYLGQRISGTLVYGTADVQLFGTLEGGLNLFEFRHTRVYLGNWTNHGYSAAWVRSGALRGIVGLAVRPWHVAIRCEANYEGYFTFSFPEEIEFMGRVEYNAEKRVWERKRTYVSAASSGTLNVFFGANLYY